MAGTSVRWAQPGRETVAAVAAAVRELQGPNPLRSVIVVTPPGSTASTLRRLLPSIDGRGIAGIRFTTVPDLALDLSPAEVRRRRPVTPLLLTAAVHEQLEHHCPPVLAGVRRHPATVDALVQAADRLRAVTIADDRAAVAEALAQGSDVRRALVAVAVAARAAIVERGYRDEPAVLAAASAALERGAEVPAPVVVVATDTFHPAQLPLLDAVLRRAPAAAVVASPVAIHDPDLAAQIERLTGHVPPPLHVGAPAQAMSCPDHDEEVRWVARRIIQLVTGPEAIAPDDVAVLYPPGTAYARSLRDELERAGLFTSGPTIESLAASTAGHALRLLLDAFSEGCDREHVLRVIAVAPEWPFGDGPRRNATRWRRLCREAGIVGVADWDVAVERLAATQRAHRERRAVNDPAFDPTEPTERDGWDIEAMQSLVKLARRMIAAAADFRRARTWVQASDVLGRELASHIGTDDWREQHWADAPVWQRRAAEQIGTLLAALTQFDHPDTALAFEPAALRRVVETELDRPVRRAGDSRQGIRLLPLQHGICLDAGQVFLVGLNDGVLPPRRTDDLVVPRDLSPDCAAVVEHADWYRRRLRRAWDALLGGAAPVTVTLRPHRPAARRNRLPIDVAAGRAAGGTRVVRGRSALDAPAHRGRSGRASRRAPRRLEHAAATSDRTRQPLRPRPHGVRRVGRPSRRARSDARARKRSPRFESHARCGLSYFIEKVLKVDTGTDPSEITEIEPMTKGNLVHAVMERLVGEWLALDPDQRPAWLQGPHLEASIARATAILDEEAEAVAAGNLLGNRHAWAIERELIVASIADELTHEAADRLEPLAVEFAFGFPDSVAPPYEFEIEGVGTLRFWGRVDRVDLAPHRVIVTDFKTSGAKDPPPVKASEVRDGLKLQLPLYAARGRRAA